MNFQLVKAGDNEIAIWQVDHGHIFVFQVCADAGRLEPAHVRDVPGAAEPASIFADEALRFATEEAQMRNLIASTKKADRNGRRRGLLAC